MSCASGVGLDARVVVERASFRLDVAIEVAVGTTTAVIGPNGAGKSTLIAALAGLVPLADGHVAVGGRTVDDGSGGTLVPPGQRGVAVAFQDGLLFDGLNVLDNVAFGLRASGASKRDARAAAQDLLDQLGLGDRSRDRPRSLSGGQAARVSLARALAVRPAVLLLDEPLASLDASARIELRPWLIDLVQAQGLTTVIVTHDPADVRALADEVVVLEDGAVADRCAAADLVHSPSVYGRAFGLAAADPGQG